MNSKPQLDYKVSVIHTFIFFFICIFLTVIALIWELRQRYHFHIYIKPKKLSDEILLSTLHDFNTFITCSDPYIEHFISKHQEFSKLSPLWVSNSYRWWTKHLKKECKRRQLQ